MPQVDHLPSTGIAQLNSLGPKSAAMLTGMGITTLTHLCQCGVIAVYVAVKRAHSGWSLNLLYGLVATLENGDWRAVQRERKLELLMAVEDAMKNCGRTFHG